MRSCSSHVQDDPDPQCAGCAAPEDQGSRGAIGNDIVGLPARGDRAPRGSPNARGNAHPAPWAEAGDAENSIRGDHPAGTRVRMIVVDASAITEFLLQTEVGARV